MEACQLSQCIQMSPNGKSFTCKLLALVLGCIKNIQVVNIVRNQELKFFITKENTDSRAVG